jgi:hypothetical protein
MRGAVFAALVATTALLPGGLAAQTVAPPEQPPASPGQQASGRPGPANICQELIAFLQPPPAPAAAGAAPAVQAQAQTQAQSAAAGAPQASPAQQTAVAAPQQSTAPSGSAQPSGQGAPTQSGLSGPTPQGTTQGTSGPQASGQSPTVTQPQPAPPAAAPAAPAGPQAPKPSPAAVEKAHAAAGSNDIAGCRSAAQEMRRAGVALPPPLIALAGLDLKYHQAAQPR